ncbi:MAG: Uma2 family endonuclease [Myxococcales bacterium]|nr:Uma2 family endonuclease [Myxococcales bacterium]
MSSAATRRATYADVLTAPERVVAEVVGGVLHTSPRPGPRHAVAASSLGSDLHGAFHRGRGGPGGWIILFEPELHLGAQPDIVVPDVTGWRRERMSDVPDEPYFTLAPDWACEVLSPATEAFDRGDKMNLYAREGLAYLWLVAPRPRTLEAYRLRDLRWERLGAWSDEAVVRVEPFEAMEIRLEDLWRV